MKPSQCRNIADQNSCKIRGALHYIIQTVLWGFVLSDINSEIHHCLSTPVSTLYIVCDGAE